MLRHGALRMRPPLCREQPYFSAHRSLAAVPLSPGRLLVLSLGERDSFEGLAIQQDFSKWLQNHGLPDACRLLTVKTAPEGRGLFAVEDVAKGTPILQLPRKLMVTPGSLPQQLLDLLPETVSPWARLALFLILHGRTGQDSPWGTYLAHLPPVGSLSSTVFWNEAELSLLPAALRNDTMNRCQLMEMEYQTLLPAIQHHTDLLDGHISYPDFIHAYATVCSRAWCIDQRDSLALVPFVDMFNHDPSSQALLCYDDDLETVEVVAECNHIAGSQVLISYGELSNSTLALDFGFVVPGNPHDTMELRMHLPENDLLLERKQTLLHEHGLLTSSGDKSSTFTLRHAGSPAGRGKGIPHSLRAWARVVSLQSEEELLSLAHDASRNEGRLARRPRRGGSSEAAAMSVLQAAIEEEILAREKVLKVVGRAMDTATLPYGRAMTLETLHTNHLRLLESVAAWLRPRALGGGLHEMLASR